jgi:hypothetical protein
MAAVQNQLGGRRVESVVLFGATEKHQALAAKIEEKIDADTELFDPFAELALGRELKKGLPDHPGRFAPLLGILLDELTEQPHAMDFLQPRRRPPPPSRRNLYTTAGLAVAVVVLLVVALGWWHRNSLKADIIRLNNEARLLDKKVQQADKHIEAAEAIGKWAEKEVVWLEELKWLAEKLPPPEELMLNQLELDRESGRMDMEGQARNVDTVKAMDRSLQDDSHQVIGEGGGASSASQRYAVRFERAVVLGKGNQ